MLVLKIVAVVFVLCVYTRVFCCCFVFVLFVCCFFPTQLWRIYCKLRSQCIWTLRVAFVFTIMQTQYNHSALKIFRVHTLLSDKTSLLAN